MASNPRGRRPEAAFEFVTQAAARRRQRLVAHVTVATWPTEQQQQRLTDGAHPEVRPPGPPGRGRRPRGPRRMRVQIGDDVIDGTVARRLDEASEQLGR
jgi:F-type H+-transporting ATPase subunit delta